MFAALATSYAEAPLPYAPAGGPEHFSGSHGFSDGVGHFSGSHGFSDGAGQFSGSNSFSGGFSSGSHGFSDVSSHGISDTLTVPAAAPAPVYGAPAVNHDVHHHETVEVIEGHANLPPPRTEIVKNVHIHKVQRILEPYPVHVDKTVIKTKHVDRPYPQPVTVVKPVPQPYPVDIVKEVIKHIPVSDNNNDRNRSLFELNVPQKRPKI